MNPLLIDIPDQIKTERLMLRVPRAGDGAIIYPAVRESFSELKQWMPWATDDYNEQAAEQWCRKCAAEFIERKQLAYLIFLRDGKHLGNTSAFALDWKVPKGEIGYWLRTSHCGQGLMTESATALTVMLLETLKFTRVEIRTDDRNERSSRVAERCGYALEGIFRKDFRYPNGTLRDTRVYAKVISLAAPE